MSSLGKRRKGLSCAGKFKPSCQTLQIEDRQEFFDCQETFVVSGDPEKREEDNKPAHEKTLYDVSATLNEFESDVGSKRFGGGSEPNVCGQRRVDTLIRRDGHFCGRIRNWISFGCGILWCLIMIAACYWYR